MNTASTANWNRNNNQKIIEINYSDIDGKHCLYTGLGVIFYDGKWGEVIKEPTYLSELPIYPIEDAVIKNDSWYEKIYSEAKKALALPYTVEESFKKKEDSNKINLNIKKSNKKSKFALQIKSIKKVKF